MSSEPTVESEWHSIRPWSPRLALSVREITSVSATFILSANISRRDLAQLDPSLVSLVEDDDPFVEPAKRPIISEELMKDLSVNVNHAKWNRVIMRVDEKTDEAIIIIYGLMPGRQYDIDIGLTQDGHSSSIRKQVVTEDPVATSTETRLDGSLSTADPDSSSSHPQTTSTSPTITVSSTTSSQSFTPFTLEERLNQLQHALSLLNAEHESLTTTLKSARRDSQKSDAALRSEIDILKRTSEKNAVTEQRARQKVLALQEAVKRAQSSTKEIEKMVQEVEELLPSLRDQREAKEAEYATVKESADQARKEVERENEKERKKLEILKNELAGLGHKMERLNGKREKIEGTIIPDLEQQLRAVEQEIGRAEADPYGYALSRSEARESVGEESSGGAANGGVNHHRMSYPPSTQSSQQTSTGCRPQPAMRRPSLSGPSTVNPHHQSWTPQRQTHRASLHLQNPTTLAGPHPKPTILNTTPIVVNTHHSQSHSGSSPPPSPLTSTMPSGHSSTTLSGRALPFEPGRGIRSMTVAGGAPNPIQRPQRNTSGAASFGGSITRTSMSPSNECGQTTG